MTVEELNAVLADREHENLEFKEAKRSFQFETLVKYCAALANEGGGHVILGVTNRRPRRVVGSQAFQDLERTKMGLLDRLRLVRVDAETVAHPGGRVVVFRVPPRPLGYPIQVNGAFWMRSGESLVPMTADRLRRIFDEVGPDYSAEVCPRATLTDLDPSAIERFRALWIRKSRNDTLATLPEARILADAELVVEGGITVAALVLLGTAAALGRHLAQAEVVFEYRSGEAAGPAQERRDFRRGFVLFHDELWERINLRNDVQHFQDGLFIWDIPTFNETAVREGVLNAVSHRDYRLPGSVFVRQFPRRIEIVSPGGLPRGVSTENILWQQAPRNRRIAEALARCGLVERSGQGVNRMFEESIKETKPRPDFAATDEHQVAVTLRGDVQDSRFLRFLERVGQERVASFSTEDLLVLDLLHHEQPIPMELRYVLPRLLDARVIESVGRGRGVRHLLSRQFYEFLGQKGIYTRRRGLDRGTNKELLLRHVEDNAETGSTIAEFMQVLPASSRGQVKTLLGELKTEGRVYCVGRTRLGRWFLGSGPAVPRSTAVSSSNRPRA